MSEIAPARPSSTVVLVRDASPAPEVLMVRRHAKSSFGSNYAFPGGVLDETDSIVHECCDGMDAAAADRALAVSGGGLDYYSAAIRELFEETGVLLATSTIEEDALQLARDRLNDGSLQWNEFLRTENLRLRCDFLHYFSFWITPTSEPKRYSTRFFIAAIPDDQQAVHDGAEITDSCWMPARDVLQASRLQGDSEQQMRLPYPTIKTLEAISAHSSLAALMNWAECCAGEGVQCVFPQLVVAAGKRRFLMPGEPGYDEAVG